MSGADLDVTWVTPVPPGTAGGGGHIRQAHLLEALAAVARVHLVCSRRVTDPTVRAVVTSLVELDFPDPPRPPGPRWRRRLRDLWLATGSREPREVAEMAVVRDALAAEVARARPGVVLIEYAGLAGLGAVPLTGGHTRVLTLHNIGSVMAAQAAAVDTVRRRRWLWQREARTWDRWLRREVNRFDLVIAVSAVDARSVPARRVAVVPNGVDTQRFRPTPLPAEPRMVFTGALYTAPNVDGVQWFCDRVLPLIRRRVPSATLTIAGLSPSAAVLALGRREGVVVLADVEDITAVVDGARVAVVPLRLGSGTRLKVLEAMAAGRPVVSTTIGAEGLDVTPGRHLRVADGEEDFAEAVVALLEADPGGMTAAARRLVESTYAWPAVAETFLTALTAVAPP